MTDYTILHDQSSFEVTTSLMSPGREGSLLITDKPPYKTNKKIKHVGLSVRMP